MNLREGRREGTGNQTQHKKKKGNMINLTLSVSRNTLHTNEYMYSCLENPRDRGAWRAAIYGVTQART